MGLQSYSLSCYLQNSQSFLTQVSSWPYFESQECRLEPFSGGTVSKQYKCPECVSLWKLICFITLVVSSFVCLLRFIAPRQWRLAQWISLPLHNGTANLELGFENGKLSWAIYSKNNWKFEVWSLLCFTLLLWTNKLPKERFLLIKACMSPCTVMVNIQLAAVIIVSKITKCGCPLLYEGC